MSLYDNIGLQCVNMGTGEDECGLGRGSRTAESRGNCAERADSFMLSSLPPSPPSR